MTLEDLQHRSVINQSVIDLDGKGYLRNAKGGLDPVELVKPAKRLEDDCVRKMIEFAVDLNAQVTRFHGHCFEDIGAFEALLAEDYGTKIGGRKGNMTLMSYDGCLKVQVQVADRIDFGPELQIAKTLLDECMNEWAAESRPEIRAIITRAFNTDKEGQINRAELFMLLRLEIEDARWNQAMNALRDAIRIVGSKTYIRFYRRSGPTAKWQAITIDLAKV